MEKNNKRVIAIIGGGFVGNATYSLKCNNVEILIYDICPEKCIPRGTTLNDLKKCDLIFIAVPTPTMLDGSCNLRIVDAVAKDLKTINFPSSKVVLRSTVTPGTSDKYGFNYMPEFLTEKNYLVDFKNNPKWIFGVRDIQTQKIFTEIMSFAKKEGKIVSDDIMFVKPKEGELIKLCRNNFLTVKVSFFNEIYQLCDATGIDFNSVKDGVCSDKRIGFSHSTVPNYEFSSDVPLFGFGGTCFYKDISNTINYQSQNNIKSYILKAALDRNFVDRPNLLNGLDARALTKH
jgi:UDPglucose 6-dehydrogenase